MLWKQLQLSGGSGRGFESSHPGQLSITYKPFHDQSGQRETWTWNLIQYTGSILQVFRCKVGVNIHSHLYVWMPEWCAYRMDRHTLLHQPASEGTSQIVRVDILQPSTCWRRMRSCALCWLFVRLSCCKTLTVNPCSMWTEIWPMLLWLP